MLGGRTAAWDGCRDGCMYRMNCTCDADFRCVVNCLTYIRYICTHNQVHRGRAAIMQCSVMQWTDRACVHTYIARRGGARPAAYITATHVTLRPPAMPRTQCYIYIVHCIAMHDSRKYKNGEAMACPSYLTSLATHASVASHCIVSCMHASMHAGVRVAPSTLRSVT